MSEWQPIETAPRDGTWFAICNARDGYESYEIGCYDPAEHWTYVAVEGTSYIPIEGGIFRREPYLIHEWRGFNNFHRATHWMPLPSPPEAKP